MELGRADFGAANGEDFAIAEVNGGGFGGPIGFREAGFDGCLYPSGTVVIARECAPSIRRFIPIVSSEPQRHQADLRHGKDIRDLHRLHFELWRRHESEGDTIGAAVEIVVPLTFSNAAHPEQHRAVGIEALAHFDLAVARRIGHHRFRRPSLTAIYGGACIDGTRVFTNRVRGAPAIHADQFVVESLNHRPGVVAFCLLHD